MLKSGAMKWLGIDNNQANELQDVGTSHETHVPQGLRIYNSSTTPNAIMDSNRTIARRPDNKKRKSRTVFSAESIRVLKEWLLQHVDDPYPNIVEKQELASRSGLTNRQINHWFINGRRRILSRLDNEKEEERLSDNKRFCKRRFKIKENAI